jgi:serine/threonine protein kinase
MRADGQMVALRVFRNDGVDLAERYKAITGCISQHRHPALVECRYLKCAVASAETFEPAPAVLMDWVPGATLDAWIAEQANSTVTSWADVTKRLASLAARWHELTKSLLECGLVHGDLEPANVIVEPSGQLRLVDYDNFCPPSFIGRATPHAGTLSYQHPGRDTHTPAFAELDNFAALTIYVLLRALAADFSLWQLSPCDKQRSLLFVSDESLDSATNRSLLHAIALSPDEQVRDLAHYLSQLQQGELGAVPPIDEVLLWCNSVESLLAQGNFDRATELVSRMGSAEKIDSALLPHIENAWQRVHSRQALQAALGSGDITAIQKEYRPELLADYPAAIPLAEQARRLVAAAAHLPEIAAACEESNWASFAQLWEQYGHELSAARAADEYQAVYKTIERATALENMLNDAASDNAQIERLWRQVFTSDEPPLTERLHSARQRREQREQLFLEIDNVLQKTDREPTFDDDRRLRRLWKQARALGETRLQPRRAHYRLAKLRIKRVRWLNDLAKAPTLAGEQQVAACLRYLPPNYHPNLPRRIQLAERRLNRIRKLEMALLEPVSERRLVRAWREVASAQGKEIVPAPWRRRVELAKRRLKLIEQLQVLSKLPKSQRDEQVLVLWDESLLSGCADAASLCSLLEEANLRVAALAKLAGALDVEDSNLVERLLAANELCEYQFSAELQSRIELHRNHVAQARQARRHGLVRAVLDHDSKQFRELFDRVLVAELCAEVPQHQPLISGWIEREILPLDKSGLKAVQTSLTQLNERQWRAMWRMPRASVANRGLLTISRDRPKPNALPSDLELLHDAAIAPPTTDAASISAEFAVEFDAEPGWRGAFVFAWAVIDLGFQTFYSEPLALGQLRPPDR